MLFHEYSDHWVNLAFLSSHHLHSQPEGLEKTVWKFKNFLKGLAGLFSRRIGILERAICVADEVTNGAYFHWIGDVLPRLEVLEENGFRDCTLVFPPMRWSQSFHDSLRAYAFQSVILKYCESVKVRHLLHMTPVAPTGNYRPRYMQAIRERFRKHYALEGVQPHRRIWISRRLAPKRKIVNEADLLPVLVKHGWEVTLMENLSFEQQVRLMAETRIVGGLHGAGLTNMLFMPEGGKVLEVRFPNDSHNNCYFSLASAMGHEYWYLLAADMSGNQTFDANVRVDPDSLEQVIKAMEG